MRLRLGNKHHLRKSADRKAQISSVSGTNAFLICAFRSADLLRWCLFPTRNLTHIFFLFPIVFGSNLIHFFDFFGEKEKTVEPDIRSFALLLLSPVSSMTNEHEDGESTKSKLQMQQLKNRSIFGDGSELGKIHLKSILITENSNNTIPDRV